MECPHCKKSIPTKMVIEEIARALDGLAIPDTTPANATAPTERTRLIAWLEHWRQDRGLPESKLKLRSTIQLQKMYAQAQIGGNCRTGRKWKSAK